MSWLKELRNVRGIGMNVKRLNRKELNGWADILGTKRKWFGLESNRSLRKRLILIIRGSQNEHRTKSQ